MALVSSTSLLAGALAAQLDTALAAIAARVQPSVVLVRTGQAGLGAGIVWRADGIVLTNHHVLGSRSATVVLDDDRQVAATVIARDPVLDLAALQVDAAALPVAQIGPSEQARVGELVLAVGHPWGQRGTVTLGIISALGAIEVAWRRSPAEYLRSDVQLAPGNSGGPLLDAQGRVIGINAMIFGGDLSVAIPAHIAEQFLRIAEGRRPVLGVGVQAVELPPAWQVPTRRTRGLLVLNVQAASPAARAGLAPGDVLLEVAGHPVGDGHALVYALARHAPAARIELRVLRGGQLRTATVTFATQPGEAAA
ncbi:S1C family serine protease [Kallotenue papyrolyticum]|uniref:S1C family serine protease n=1 Tax=Kallotenue papyrolyticum TaxID=1325125 RepID=UPI0004785441|nr:trypsin-like peptidase domain-containing protein [Kallotenue papyrolyticum]